MGKCFAGTALVGALLLLGLCPAVVRAAADFDAIPDATFLLPLSGSADDDAIRFTLFVNTKEGSLARVIARPVDVRGPGGAALPTASVSWENVPELALTPAGEQLRFTAGSKNGAATFGMPGSYTVTLVLQGEAVDKDAAGKETRLARSRTVRVQFVRPPSVVTSDWLKDYTVDVIRWIPLLMASNTVRHVSVPVAAGGSALLKPSFYVQPVLDARKIAARGAVKVADRRTTTGAVGPGELLPLTISVENLRGAGDFTTNWQLSSASLASAAIFPLRVRVRDFFLWPLLVIAAGVAGSAWVRTLLDRDRPALVNRYRLQHLRAELDWYLPRAGAGETAVLTALEEALKRAEIWDAVGETALARTELTAAQGQMTDFRKTHLTARAVAYDREAALSTRLDKAVSRIPPPGPAPAPPSPLGLKGHEARELLNRAKEALDDDRVDAAGLRLGAAEILILALEQATAPLAGAPALHAATVAIPRADRLALVASALPEERTAGEYVAFLVTGPAELLGRASSFRWDFGDHPPQGDILKGAGRDARHAYRAKGTYSVRATLLDGDGEPLQDSGGAELTAVTSVTIAPSPAERQAEFARRALRQLDVRVAMVAFVIATLSGFAARYWDQPFGTWNDYIQAFLWGFGITAVVQGFTGAVRQLQPGTVAVP